ncbi:hypothetical protein OE09_2821 [Flavobacteriaceae bacterium MAR_2010_72]|nr:hypothetical protein OE09_2821 [Flavobacteriaceae bacterium MAR_2010_72]
MPKLGLGFTVKNKSAINQFTLNDSIIFFGKLLKSFMYCAYSLKKHFAYHNK